jgi:Mg-chelatase subunit ChlD
MKKSFCRAFCLALITCLILTGNALSAAPLKIMVSKVDSTDFPTVTVQFSAWDNNGIPLSDLKSEDIFLKEDSNSEFHPTELQADTNAQLSVVLVMDVSGSMNGQPLEDAKNAANRFLTKLDKSDQAGVIAFSKNVQTDPATLDPTKEIGFSNNLTGAFNLIEGLKAAGETEVYNAVEKAVKMAAALPPGHRVVLLLTDGKNEPANVGDPEAAITIAKGANIPVFVIGLGNEIDADYLNRLTSETGGVYRQTPHSSDLGLLFNDMATLLKTDYSIKYESSLPSDGKNHSLSLRIVTGQGEATTTMDSGVLPKTQPSPTISVSTPASQVIATVQPTAQPTITTWFNANKVIILICVAFLIVVSIIIGLLRRKKTVAVEKCANCGVELHDLGPCPMCGSTKRIKSNK